MCGSMPRSPIPYQGDARLRSQAAAMRGWLAIMHSERSEEWRWTGESVELAGASGDPKSQLLALYVDGVGRRATEDLKGATVAHDAAIAFADDLGLAWWSAAHRYGLGLVLVVWGNAREAAAAMEALLEEASSVGDPSLRAYAQMALGRLAFEAGALDEAERWLSDGLAGLSSPTDAQIALVGLGDVAAARDDDDGALGAYRRGLELMGGLGGSAGYMLSARVATVLLRMDRRVDAAELLGALSTLGDEGVIYGPWSAEPAVAEALATVRSDAGLSEAWQAGSGTGSRRSWIGRSRRSGR